MKKIILFLLMFLGLNTLYANDVIDGKKRFDNIIVTSHGNYYEIVDNEKNVCVYVRVEEDTNRFGETVYNLFCENEKTKGITKDAIKTVLGSYLTVKYAIPNFLTNRVVDYVYEEVCDYFE